MRFVLELELQQNKLPIEYRKLVLSYLKNTLSKCNEGKYYDRFFKDTTQKDYCFSVVLPKSKFLKDEILLEDREIKIIFTTDDRSNTGFILFNAFISQKN
ncbi:MAG: CRISPR-associated endoribonuclease Cas6, partial [Clostridium sp.]